MNYLIVHNQKHYQKNPLDSTHVLASVCGITVSHSELFHDPVAKELKCS